MTTLSIVLPDRLAQASKEIAREMGISRTEFIRKAITHEIKHIKVKREEQAIIESLLAMKKHPLYLKQTTELLNEVNSELPEEDNAWWNQDN